MSETQPQCFSTECKDIFEALSKTQGQVKGAEKNQEASISNTRKYDYSDLDSVYEACRAVAASHGLAVITRFPPDKNVIHLLLTHSTGQWIDYGEYPLGNAERHQDRGSALTYARRYTLSAIYGIAPKGDDDDGMKGNDALGKPAYSPPAPPVKHIFATAAERNRYVNSAAAAFETALTLEDLKQAGESIKAKMEEMRKGSEFDILAVEELERRYKRAGEKFKNDPKAPGPRTVESVMRGTTIPGSRSFNQSSDLDDEIPY